MQGLSVVDWITLGSICMICSVLSVAILAKRIRAAVSDPGSIDGVTWIFDGVDLVDSSARARQLTDLRDGPFFWSDLHKELSIKFPTFPESQNAVESKGQIFVSSLDKNDPSEILCESIDGITRVSLKKKRSKLRVSADNAEPLFAASQELETLRFAANNAHYPVWRVNNKGEVVWFNKAYEKLCETVLGHKPGPDTALFSQSYDIPIPTKKARRNLTIPESGQKLWFDVTIVQCDGGTLIYGIDVNAVVDAELAQRNFVQTLAKTFAQLSIGLAIFDRNRQLVLFNPALIDLTALPADFLSARPTLLSFFDRLRDQRMMPEPKNYGSWREQMAELVEAAADGRYQETWSLPSGSVYSVNGRPHPDGAVAFLFEDITAEITLTRRFRSDLELGQAIFDQLDDAIVVFSLTGGLIFSNASYQKLWNVDPEKAFAQTAILDAMRVWQSRCMATPIWGDIRDFVSERENRAEWSSTVTLKSGETLACTIHPIQSGATMINFSAPGVLSQAENQKTPVVEVI